ncbi:MAG: TIGR02266 family protein [bacterium]|nr:TIGR02266 family protein [bacterium]
MDVKFESLSTFMSTHSKNISRGGMFLQTDDPPPVGTPLGFDLKLGDGFSLVRGRGEVVWSQPASDASTQVPGMAVKFLALDDQSRTLIDKMVDDVMESGAEPFLLSRFLEDLDATVAQESAPPIQASIPFSSQTDNSPAAPEILAMAEEHDAPDEKPVEAEPVASDESSLPADLPMPDPENWEAVDDGGEATLDVVDPRDLPSSLPEASHKPRQSSRKGLWVVLACVAIVVGIGVVWKLVLPMMQAGGTSKGDVAVAQEDAGLDETSAVESKLVDSEPSVEVPQDTTELETPAEPLSEGAMFADATADHRAEAAATSPLGGRATAVDSISWDENSRGGLVVTVTCNGNVAERSLRSEPLIQPPRHVLRVRGIERPYGFPRLTPDHAVLSSIRLGYHSDRNPPELHIVFDLASATVAVSDVQIEGNQIFVVVE